MLAVVISTFLFTTRASATSTAIGACDEIVEAQANFSKVMRVRDRAYMREIVRRSERGLDLVCFKSQISTLANLGRIFSDVEFSLEGLSFDPLLFCDLLSGVVDGSITGGGAFGVYGPDLSQSLGFMLGSNMSLPPIELCVNTSVDISMEISASIGFFIDISITFFGVTCPLLSLEGDVGLTAGINANFSDICITLDVDPFTCNDISDLWSDGSNYSTEGSGINEGGGFMFSTDLFDAADMIPSEWITADNPLAAGVNGLLSRGTFSEGPGFGATAGDGTEFNHELAVNRTILQNARKDVEIGALSGPGSSPCWPIVPDLTGKSVDDLILLMNP